MIPQVGVYGFMGCWKGTCGVSGLAIREGEPVRLLLIQESEYAWDSGSVCRHDDVFRVRGLPLKGLYDDYGNLEKVEESVLTDLLVEAFRQDAVPHEDSCEDEVIDPPTLTLDRVLNTIERGHMQVRYRSWDARDLTLASTKLDKLIASHMTWKEKIGFYLRGAWKWVSTTWKNKSKAPEAPPVPARIGMFMVHERIFQAVINNARNRSREHARSVGQQVAEKLRDMADSWRGEQGNGALDRDLNASLREILGTFGPDALKQVMGLGQRFCNNPKIEDSPVLQRATLDADALDHIAKTVEEFILFDAGMDNMRKAYHITCGAGLQQDDRHLLFMTAFETVSIIKERDDEDNEDYGEDANEELHHGLQDRTALMS